MTAQILSVLIFLLMFALIITEKLERHIVTLLCAAATLIFVFGIGMHSYRCITETLNLRSIVSAGFWIRATEEGESGGINWATIFFIAGMMVMVEGMAKAGFFRWLCLALARAVRYRVSAIFLSFMLLSALLSMFIDSITVILFLAAVTVELARMLRFDPIPLILSEIFCANLGGSATMCGDPPNIIIGTSLGYSFFDFINNTGAIAGISLILVIVYFYFYFKKHLHYTAQIDPSSFPHPKEAITDKRKFTVSTVIFLLAVALLITHSMTGLTVASIGLLIAVLTLVAAGRDALSILKKVDYQTLLFFVGLFVVVGGLEKSGILTLVASAIGSVSGGNFYVMTLIIIWVSGIASAFIDNIPFAATMIPVIKSLSATEGIGLNVLTWALSMGTDIGGSATPIGASANVVGTSVAAKEGYPVGWGRYCKAMVPATVIVLLTSCVSIWLRYLS